MQAQQAIALPRETFSRMIAVVATAVAVVLALALVLTVEHPTTSATPAVVTLHTAGSEQVAHDRSEQGLGGSGSVSGEQISHNRSEEGLANP